MNREIWDKWKKTVLAVFLLGLAAYEWQNRSGALLSVTYMAGFYLVLASGYYYGAGAGTIAGTAAGMGLTVLNQTPEQIGVLCVAGLAVGFFGQLGIVVGALAYTAAFIGGSIMYAPELANEGIWELLFTLVFFGILHPLWGNVWKWKETLRSRHGSLRPGRSRMAGGQALSAKNSSGFHSSASVLSEWMEQYAHRLQQLSFSFQTMPVLSESFGQLSVILEQAGEKSEELLQGKGGGKGEGFLPDAELSALKNKRRVRNSFEVSEEQHSITGTRFSVSFGVAKCTKEGEYVSGDQFSCMKLPGNQAMAGICDGMGSGRQASQDSRRMIELMEQLMEAGFLLRTAVRMVHTLMLYEQNEDVSVTMDFALLDLEYGDCEMIKSGAAASFVRHGNTVEMIRAESLPIGILPECNPTESCFRLRYGDIVVMVSDGVLEAIDAAGKEEAMAGFLAGIDPTLSPDEFAAKVLEFACAGGEVADDMLVLILYIADSGIIGRVA